MRHRRPLARNQGFFVLAFPGNVRRVLSLLGKTVSSSRVLEDLWNRLARRGSAQDLQRKRCPYYSRCRRTTPATCETLNRKLPGALSGVTTAHATLPSTRLTLGRPPTRVAIERNGAALQALASAPETRCLDHPPKADLPHLTRCDTRPSPTSEYPGIASSGPGGILRRTDMVVRRLGGQAVAAISRALLGQL